MTGSGVVVNLSVSLVGSWIALSLGLKLLSTAGATSGTTAGATSCRAAGASASIPLPAPARSEFARVEDALGIENPFYLAKDFIEWAILFAHKRGPAQPIAMLAAIVPPSSRTSL